MKVFSAAASRPIGSQRAFGAICRGFPRRNHHKSARSAAEHQSAEGGREQPFEAP
jgi:hypothetical protein